MREIEKETMTEIRKETDTGIRKEKDTEIVVLVQETTQEETEIAGIIVEIHTERVKQLITTEIEGTMDTTRGKNLLRILLQLQETKGKVLRPLI